MMQDVESIRRKVQTLQPLKHFLASGPRLRTKTRRIEIKSLPRCLGIILPVPSGWLWLDPALNNYLGHLLSKLLPLIQDDIQQNQGAILDSEVWNITAFHISFQPPAANVALCEDLQENESIITYPGTEIHEH